MSAASPSSPWSIVTMTRIQQYQTYFMVSFPTSSSKKEFKLTARKMMPIDMIIPHHFSIDVKPYESKTIVIKIISDLIFRFSILATYSAFLFTTYPEAPTVPHPNEFGCIPGGCFDLS